MIIASCSSRTDAYSLKRKSFARRLHQTLFFWVKKKREHATPLTPPWKAELHLEDGVEHSWLTNIMQHGWLLASQTYLYGQVTTKIRGGKKSINENRSNARTYMTGKIRNGWKTSRIQNEPAISRLPYHFHGISTKIAAGRQGREISNACTYRIGSNKILGSPYPDAHRTLLCSVLTLP